MNSESDAKEFLEQYGFSVSKIPEANHKTPDFLVKDVGDSYLIELKCKEANPEVVAQREAAMDAGEIFEEDEKLLHQNRLSGLIRGAVDQLVADEFDERPLKLVWLMGTGHDASAKMAQFEATLLGSTHIWSKNRVLPCYYFSNSAFFRHKSNLDGAIISTPRELKLCLNNHSPRFEELKKSNLCTVFYAGVLNPIGNAENGVALIVDADLDRNCSEAVIQYLRGKYSDPKLTDITISEFAVTATRPHET